MLHKDDTVVKYHNTSVLCLSVKVTEVERNRRVKFTLLFDGCSNKRRSVGAEAAVWLVSPLKRSKNGKCLQCGAVFFTSPYRAGRICFQSDPYETYLLSLSSSNMTDGPRWQPFKIKRVQRYRQEVALYNLPHGVHLPVVVLGYGENESQVLWSSRKEEILTLIPFLCSRTVGATL